MKIRKYIWEIVKLLRPGKDMIIKPTMRCNLNCDYCTVNKAYGRQPKYNEKPVEFWTKLIAKKKPKSITISGGEPGLYHGLAVIVNFAISKGIPVQIMTNLTRIGEFQAIKKSPLVYLLSTYHPCADLIDYRINHDRLISRLHIEVREVRPANDLKPKYIPWAKVIPMKDEQSDKRVEIYAPNGYLYYSCKQLDEGGQ